MSSGEPIDRLRANDYLDMGIQLNESHEEVRVVRVDGQDFTFDMLAPHTYDAIMKFFGKQPNGVDDLE